ncbi:hypothetical protein KSP39_PZI002628 [Platanthera zijinensis]|uniref:Uncharacterized protein n=1 Tax=Platanthera zijinensis TaxID=2320716 RepID=A0AAP0GEL4_9ASPA
MLGWRCLCAPRPRELRAELANACCESVLLREQLRAELAKVPPPELDARLRSRYLSEYDVDKLLQANAQATVKLTLETLRDVELLREDGATIDARQLLPWLYDPVPKPPGAPDSPLSDVPRSSTAVGETSEEGSGDDSSESTSGDYSAWPLRDLPPDGSHNKATPLCPLFLLLLPFFRLPEAAKALTQTQSLSWEVPPHTRKISESFPSKAKCWAGSSSEDTRVGGKMISLHSKEPLWLTSSVRTKFQEQDKFGRIWSSFSPSLSIGRRISKEKKNIFCSDHRPHIFFVFPPETLSEKEIVVFVLPACGLLNSSAEKGVLLAEIFLFRVLHGGGSGANDLSPSSSIGSFFRPSARLLPRSIDPLHLPQSSTDRLLPLFQHLQGLLPAGSPSIRPDINSLYSFQQTASSFP